MSEKKLIILHGWQSQLERWQGLVKGLEGKRFKIFLPQLPGFGKNKISQPWDLNDYVDWLKNYLKVNKIYKYYLLGHSFGGRIAIKYAATSPQSLKGLFLVNSAGIKPRLSLKKIIFFVLAKTGRRVFSLPPFSFFRRPARFLLYFLAREKDYYQANSIMKKTMKKIINQDLRSLLGKIKVPTLIIWGENDQFTPLKDGQLLKQRIANSKLIIYDKVGHGLPFIKTPNLVKDIVNFCYHANS